MQAGTPIWVYEAELWQEGIVISVNSKSNIIECSLENSTNDDCSLNNSDALNHHFVQMIGHTTNENNEMSSNTARKRRNSRNNIQSKPSRVLRISQDLILPRNPQETYYIVEDLTKLVHLHEPAILKVLYERFRHGLIYTSTGSILVALNPFRRIENIYSDNVKYDYFTHGQESDESKKAMPPHVFAVADKAFRNITSSQIREESKANQTVLVSGESGAGKTETTKLIMSYLAFASTEVKREHEQEIMQRRSSGHLVKLHSLPTKEQKQHQREIHERVLDSNPILEAFGNARTTRNNNSSRFGKFIRLGFSSRGEMLGASISTYLLERVRLVSQGEGERNYHIFYELLSQIPVLSENEANELALLPEGVNVYNYLNQSNCTERLDGVDDAQSYLATRAAMGSIGMPQSEQLDVMKVVSAVLHLGNISFREDQHHHANIDTSETSTTSTKAVCKLLHVEIQYLTKILCTKDIKAGSEFITKRLSVDQATLTRDSIAKTLYANLFKWLVDRINASIHYEVQRNSRFIGVVDIFGFEIFQQNSLEQLCINYANEKLQQVFAQFVFQMEQQEYEAEDIGWESITYPNNDHCVVLLESRKPLGMFALLDEQCLIPQGNDEKLANKLYEKLGHEQQHSSFAVGNLQRARREFVIKHYAGDVCYASEGFCGKNKDQMHTEAMELLQTSDFKFVREVFNQVSAVASPPPRQNDSAQGRKGSNSIHSTTVVMQFKQQLNSLLEVITATSPHFIRCVKPNDDASWCHFHKPRLVEQLRCAGVLEAVKISRSGYPVRFLHHNFLHMYSCLVTTSQRSSNVQNLVTTLYNNLGINSHSQRLCFQVGKTKVFCSQEAHDALERKRTAVLYKYVVAIQRCVKGYAVRQCYLAQRRAIVTIQRCWRKFFSYQIQKKMKMARERACIVKIQSLVRSRFQKRTYLQTIRSITIIQSFIRGWLVRREYSANTISFEEDASYVGSLDLEHESLSGSLNLSKSSLDSSMYRDDHTLQSRSTVSSSLSRSTLAKGEIENYKPPSDIANEYEIVWECGLLGLYFESDSDSGMPIVRRVHESLSNCEDIFEVSRGDILLSVGDLKVKKGEIRRILAHLQEVKKPVVMRFQRPPDASFRLRAGSLELLGEEDYEVLWRVGVPLGLGFQANPDAGYPAVLHGNGNQMLPGMFNVRAGDFLTHVNEFCTHQVPFEKVIDILQTGPRPAVLRFRHSEKEDAVDENGFSIPNPVEDEWLVRQSVMSAQSLNQAQARARASESLYYLTWQESDGPLGIVVKQEVSSYYPRVINVKDIGAVCRNANTKDRVEVGDILMSINNNDISRMGFGAAMQLLQKGPKPLLLMFQRAAASYQMSKSLGNLRLPSRRYK